MFFDIEVNHKTIKARRGETILQTLNRNGIKVPTLCNMPEFTPTGACRICVVEVEGKHGLVPSCSFQVEENMKVQTHSPRVVRARKNIVELLLSNHPDDCLYCDRNCNCELQSLAAELDIRERIIFGKRSALKADLSSPSVVRDLAKCILCGRCVRICEEVLGVYAIDFIRRGNMTCIGTAFNKPLNFSNCIHCGQCVMVCPTAALREKNQFPEILEHINNPEKELIVQYSPMVALSLNEEFGIRSAREVSGILNGILRKMGFSKIYDTSFAADLCIIEQAEELIARFEKGGKFPVISGFCQAVVKYIEQFAPDIIPFVSTCRSPQQAMGSLIKNYYAGTQNISPEKIYSVSIVPCTARKAEAQREEMTHKGISDIDAVITTREFIRLIRLYGIDVHSIEPDLTDAPFNIRSAAGMISAAPGGFTEALIRTLYYKISGKEMSQIKNNNLRGTKAFKEVKVKINGNTYNFAAFQGLAHFIPWIDKIRKGETDFHFIEIAACPGGCAGGGGQPYCCDEKIVKSQLSALYDVDDTETIKVAHKNPAVTDIYSDFLGNPLSEKSTKLLHTTFKNRENEEKQDGGG
jgi:iron-only hydrogenase group A